MTAEAKMSGKRPVIGRLVHDYILLSGGQLLSKLIGFLAFAWLARILTVAEYGAVETVVGMSVIGYKVVEFGAGAIAVRWIAQRSEPLKDVLGALISARMLTALLIVPTLGLFYSLSARDELPSALVWLFALSLFAAPFAHEWLFQAKERMGVAAMGPLLRMSAFAIAILALAPDRNGVVMVGAAEILALLATAFFFSAMTRPLLAGARPTYGLKPAVRLLRESAPLGVSAFFNSFGLYAPVLVVTALAGADEAGWFGAAHRIVASVITFSYAYYFNVYPLFSRLLQENPARLQAVFGASMRITSWAGLTAAAGLWSLGEPIMSIVFGAGFSPGSVVLRALVWMMVFELISGNARWLLVAAGRQSSVLLVQGMGAAVTIALAFALAPSLGGFGAAIATVIGNGVIWIAAQILTAGLPARPPLRPILQPAIFAGLAVSVAALVDLPAIGEAAIVGAIMALGAALDRGFVPSLRLLSGAKSPGRVQ